MMNKMQYRKIAGEIKSPLRYPGAKAKIIDQIIKLMPSFKEYREPFVGGGSVFLAVKQRIPSTIPILINDLHNDLYCFWKVLKENPQELIQQVEQIQKQYRDANQIRDHIQKNNWTTDVQKAVRYFILNRIGLSPESNLDSGSFTQNTYERGLTPSSLSKLKQLKEIMANIQVFNEDYAHFLSKPGKDVFIFLDPPYFRETKTKLYGSQGDLQRSFDHERFINILQKCTHKWLLTYYDTPMTQKQFSFAHIREGEMHAGEGRELYIYNY